MEEYITSSAGDITPQQRKYNEIVSIPRFCASA